MPKEPDGGMAAFLGRHPDLVITKEYPPQGNLQRFRVNKETTFTCVRCKKKIKSKILVVRDGDWTGGLGDSEGGFLCEACYFVLLSEEDD